MRGRDCLERALWKQLAKLFGARVIATTSSADKAERLKALGADEVINYRNTPDWHVAVRALTDGRGADVVVEVGGAGTLEKSLKATAAEGQISIVGSLAKETATINVNVISATVVKMHRIAVGNRAQFTSMNRAVALHRLKPVIDRVFPFREAIEAFRYYEAGSYFGKIVISNG
jgi:NADPH:quinone reductase-like Zn-dependent oxidoreductase